MTSKSQVEAIILINSLNYFEFNQELELRMERMTDEAATKRKALEHELTQTMTAQVTMDRFKYTVQF